KEREREIEGEREWRETRSSGDSGHSASCHKESDHNSLYGSCISTQGCEAASPRRLHFSAE
ncbi:hypothetical protein J6590_103609, partial [Homalodisca vitripennis]